MDLRWGEGRTEVIALRDEILAALGRGLSVRRIHQELTAAGKLRIAQSKFYLHVARLVAAPPPVPPMALPPPAAQAAQFEASPARPALPAPTPISTPSSTSAVPATSGAERPRSFNHQRVVTNALIDEWYGTKGSTP